MLNDSLRKVLGYVQADIVEPACTSVPLTRDAVADDGTITDVAARERTAIMLSTLANELARRAQPQDSPLSPPAVRLPLCRPRGTLGRTAPLMPRVRLCRVWGEDRVFRLQIGR